MAVILLLTFVLIKTDEKKQGIGYMIRTMAILLPIVGLVGTNNLSTAIIILGIGVILILFPIPDIFLLLELEQRELYLSASF